MNSFVPLLSLISAIFFSCSKGSGGSDKPIATPLPTLPPAFVREEVQDIVVTSMQVFDPTNKSGTPNSTVSVKTNFPVQLLFNLLQTGGAADTQISFGLMEQLTEEQIATGVGGSQKHCFLGSTTVHHPGDGTETAYEATFVVPPECAEDGASAKYNVYVAIDAAGEVRLTETESEGNVVIYNEDLLSEDRNQKCKRGDATVGCIFEVTVNPSSGLNLSMASLELTSSVATLVPLTEDTGAVDEDGNPTKEAHKAFVEVISTVLLTGAAPDNSTALTDKNGRIVYDICAASLYHETCKGDVWKPLTVLSKDTNEQRSGHSAELTIASLLPNEPSHFSSFLFAEGETYTALASGGEWSSEKKFALRSCVKSDLTEVAMASNDPAIAQVDNCQVQLIALVESDGTASRAFAERNAAGNISSYSFIEDWTQNAGNRKTIRADTKFSTENVLNLDGAFSAETIKLRTLGKVNMVISETSFRAAAYTSLLGSNAEMVQEFFGFAIYTKSAGITDVWEYEEEISYEKELCNKFKYDALIISLKGSMCMGGKVGLKGTFAIKAVTGAGAPFNDAQRVGEISYTFGPFLGIGAEAKASANAGAARAGIKGTLNIATAEHNNKIALQWGLMSLDPPVLKIVGKVFSVVELRALEGNINVWADLREVDTCTRSWKICGRRFRVHYPCGFSWHRKVDENLVDFTVEKFKFKLLSRNATLTLQ